MPLAELIIGIVFLIGGVGVFGFLNKIVSHPAIRIIGGIVVLAVLLGAWGSAVGLGIPLVGFLTSMPIVNAGATGLAVGGAVGMLVA